MMMATGFKSHNMACVLSILMLIGTQSAFAGLNYREETKTQYYQLGELIDQESTVTEYTVGTQAMRITDTKSLETTILRKDLELIWTIYPDSTYTEITFDQARRIAQLTADGVPDEMGTEAPMSVHPTAEFTTIQRIKSQKYEIMQDERLVTEVWMSVDFTLEAHTLDLLNILKSFAPSAFSAITELQGLPMRTKSQIDIDDYKIISETEVIAIDSNIQPASRLFVLPSNLDRIEISY